MIDSLLAQAKQHAHSVKVLASTGLVRPIPPQRLAVMGLTLQRWGLGMAGGFQALAARSPNRVGIIDELGELTWREIDQRTTRLANSLDNRGVRAGDSVAVLCRNHRYMVEISIALSKVGADILYLNTAFSGPQLGEVCARENPSAIVYDEEFERLIDVSGVKAHRIVAWADGAVERDLVEDLIAQGPATKRKAPERPSRPVILTSGTTGTPKGAPRGEAGIDAAVSILSRIPVKNGWTSYIAAPLFHTWGWAFMNLAMLMDSTMVLRRKFDPRDALETLDRTQADQLVVIPVMLQRILALPAEDRQLTFPNLKAVCASGSALPGDLGIEWMNAFGDTLYNTYGSTECAWATIAQPADLRRAPGTAGLPPKGTIVRLFDTDDRPAGNGPGRIFVGNSMLFEGYTGTTDEKKAQIDGLMSTGDVGRFDNEGYLFVEGRDDDMIVSGGENLFPGEVEDCLSRHPAVAEVAAIGVDDEEFGKRLRAFVVRTGEVSEDDLKAHVKENLARYKVPREILFLDELPRNATGKVLKRELREYDA